MRIWYAEKLDGFLKVWGKGEHKVKSLSLSPFNNESLYIVYKCFAVIMIGIIWEIEEASHGTYSLNTHHWWLVEYQRLYSFTLPSKGAQDWTFQKKEQRLGNGLISQFLRSPLLEILAFLFSHFSGTRRDQRYFGELCSKNIYQCFVSR